MDILKYVELTVVLVKEGNQYNALCLELGTPSCGDTVEEAFENAKDAILVHLHELERTGQRERIFKERKIILSERRPKKKAINLRGIPRDSFAVKHDFPLAVVAAN